MYGVILEREKSVSSVIRIHFSLKHATRDLMVCAVMKFYPEIAMKFIKHHE